MSISVAARPQLDLLKKNLTTVIKGKEACIDIVCIAFLAGGSILMRDVPGVGKTTLAKALAHSLGLRYNRVQFTPDLLPADILGSSIYNPKEGRFDFHKGPVFCNVLLADEINRASPRTQSALLEAMSENQATIEGKRYPLEPPFLVIATENPVEYQGTYPLPEAQLDRFLVQVDLGYPDNAAELEILYTQSETHPLEQLQAVVTKEDILAMQQAVRAIHVEASIGQYIVEIIDKTRSDVHLKLGGSPRASLMLFRAAQAAAYEAGRDFVLPDDVQRLSAYVLPHRMMLTSKAKYGGVTKRQVVSKILEQVPVPS